MKKKIVALSLAVMTLLTGVSGVYALENPVASDAAVSEDKVVVIPVPTPYPATENTVAANSKEDEQKMLEKVILFVKNNIYDTDLYDQFSYNSYLNGYGNTTFNLNWSNDSGDGYMYATVDSSEFVQSFYRYDRNSYNYSSDKKIVIPSFTKNDALEAAIDFVGKIAPEYIGQISDKFADVYVNRYYSPPTYSVTLYRVIDGIMVEGEALNVEIDANGQILSYSNYGTKNISKDIPKTIALSRTIINAFKTSLPLELRYISSYDYETQKSVIRLAYVTPGDSKVIDAATGKTYQLEYKDVGTYDNGRTASEPSPGMAEGEAYDSAGIYDKRLSSVEQAAVDNHPNLLNADDIKEILLKYEDLSFNENLGLSYSYLNTSESSYSDKTTYYLSLSFTGSNESGSVYVYVEANAETGEIRSYSYSDSDYPVIPYTATEEEKAEIYKTYLSRDDAVKNAAKLLGEMYGDKFTQFRLDESEWSESDSYGYLSYTRYVNGIPFDGDSVNVSFNRASGKIISVYFRCSDDAVFPSADRKISASQAVDKLFGEFPMTPFYKAYIEIDEENSVMYYTYNSEVEKKLALVYSYGDTSSVVVDAVSGELYYRWSASEKAVYTPNKYHDPNALDVISGHASEEQMTVIYNLGAIDIGKDFAPDAAVTSDGFENIINSVINSTSYYRYYERSDSEEQAADGNRLITKEDAVISMVNLLGYGDIAKIGDIFKDIEGIDTSLTGYYAIAGSFGLLNEIPDSTEDGYLTYAGACCLVYNYILYTNAE